MKKVIFVSFLVLASKNLFSQIVVQGISPNSIQGNYNHTWADPASGWGTPNFNVPGNFVQDTLMLVNDGSVGLNAQGNPISAEGCNPLINNLTGKIAVIYRNTCDFGLKASNAQNAGAVGVIIINREPGVISMGSGAYGANVNIPVVMLSLSDGQSLVSEMQNGPVVVLMGNVSNFYANNLGLKKQNILAPKRAMTPISIAQNGTEFNFHVGGYVHNFGNQAQSNITLNAQILNPAGTTIYNENIVIPFLASGDSALADPTIFPLFQPSSYTLGDYYLTYTVSSGNTEEASDDNTFSYKFSITNDIFSYAKSNSTSGLPTSQNHYGNSQGSISICQTIIDPNASRLLADGLYFSAAMQAPNSLIGQEIYLTLYQWDDQFTDISDPNFSFNSLNSIASGVYTYGSNLQNQSVYAPFNNSVQLVDNQRYLACAQTYSQNVFLGFDNIDYSFNTNYYLQPLTPLEYGGTFYSLGFGADLPASLGVKVSTCQSPSSNTTSVSACESYTTSNGETFFQSSVIQDTLYNIYGCDSLYLTINLTITNSDVVNFSQSICSGEVYIWNGQPYSTTGQYSQILSNQNGCDSSVYLNLTVNTNDFVYFSANPTFGNSPLNVAFANQTQNINNYNFTWSFGDGSIEQSNASFLAHLYTTEGYHDVTLIAENVLTGCATIATIDSLIYVLPNQSGLNDFDKNSISIYPNPSSERFTLEIPENVIGNKVVISDLTGRKMIETNLTNKKNEIEIEELSSGSYFIVVDGDSEIRILIKR